MRGEHRAKRPRLRRKRVICTAATGDFTQLLEIALPALREYAHRHRFDLVVVTHNTAHGRPAAWSKIPIVYRLLDAYELVVWIDADAIVVDPSRNIADEFTPGKDLYLVEHYHEPTGEQTANTGVLMFCSGRWAKELLAAVWARADLIDHAWWENAAIMSLLGYRLEHPARREHYAEWSDRTLLLDVAYNSMPHWCASPAPVINHYAALPLAERRARMLTDVR